MKEITKLEKTSPSDFTLCKAELLHAEECQRAAFFMMTRLVSNAFSKVR